MVDRKLGRGLDFFLSPANRGVAPTPPQAPAAPATPATKPAAASPATPAAAPAPEAPAAEPAFQVTIPSVPPAAPVAQPAASIPGTEVRLVPIAELAANPYQPRTGIDQSDLAELTESIRQSGVLQPILARRLGSKLQIVAGERRWRAAKLAGLEEVPVLVREITDQDSAVFALVENLQREDLNAIEKAQAFRQLQKHLGAKQEEVAQKVGLDRSTVANFMRLLDLAPEVQQHVSRGTLSMGHARALLAIKDPKLQVQLADEVVRQSLSVRALEELARQHAVGLPGAAQPAKKKDPQQIKAAWLKEIEETLADTFSTSVQVKYGRKSSTIEITCAGREEFERIYARLKEA